MAEFLLVLGFILIFLSGVLRAYEQEELIGYILGTIYGISVTYWMMKK